MKPLVGQSWSLLIAVMGHGQVRVEHRVEEVHGSVTILRSLTSGKLRTLSTSVLVHGRRGARLTRNADGTAVELWANGTRPATLHARGVRAAKLHAEGVSLGTLAERYGVDVRTVVAWVGAARREANR